MPWKSAFGVKRTWLPTMTAAPLAGVPTLVIVSGSPSGSESFASTAIRIGAPSSSIEAVSLAATGSRLTCASTVTVVVSGRLSSAPSFTTSWAMKRPERSATKLGVAVSAPFNVALLPAGVVVSDQKKVSGSPFASLEPVPSRLTVAPCVTVWSGPAFATGRVLLVLMTTVSAALSTKPSLTMSCATKSPARSAVNCGVAVVAPLSAAVEPAGRVSSVHR